MTELETYTLINQRLEAMEHMRKSFEHLYMHMDKAVAYLDKIEIEAVNKCMVDLKAHSEIKPITIVLKSAQVSEPIQKESKLSGEQ